MQRLFVVLMAVCCACGSDHTGSSQDDPDPGDPWGTGGDGGQAIPGCKGPVIN